MRLSLTTRLVVTAVVLVIAVCTVVAVIATLAMQSHLTSRLDEDVRRSARILAAQVPAGDPGTGTFGGRYQSPGTLNAVVGEEIRRGRVLGESPGTSTELTADDLALLARLPSDDQVHAVTLPSLGSFRVAVTQLSAALAPDRPAPPSGSGAPPMPPELPEGVLITGLPTEEVDQAVGSLIRSEVALVGLGSVAAAGAGVVVVRRQLRPLRDVAATAHAVADLPLASGSVGTLERVPSTLTDERTEVGQVGAALNTLLAHVESSLAARHRSEEQIRQFVADASHELRTPLTTIRGYAELARSRPETGPMALAKVDEESGRMTSLVEDLLLLARLDSGRPLLAEPVDLSRLVFEAVHDAQVVGPDHVWVVEAPDLSMGSPVEVLGDEQRLHQVVTNLLTNARRYTPPGTTVTVRITQAGFSVHDDGPGFPDGLDPFERFARGDSSRQHHAGSGAGLGLALVKAIVTAHGGVVTVDSHPGDTTISVRLRPAG